MITIRLKKGRDKPVRMGHPWIFNGALQTTVTSENPGELCRVVDSGGQMLGTGYYNPQSSICVRMLTLGSEGFTHADLTGRIAGAIGLRSSILGQSTDSCRLVNSEGDFLPGLVIDRYAGGVIVQILTAGMEQFRDSIISSIRESLDPHFIYERSDSEARTREGLPMREGLLHGEMPAQVDVKENGVLFRVDLQRGQKTGFFFDQRLNRELARAYAAGRKVCDCFSYSGAFAINTLQGGAQSVDAVDISAAALAWARENLALNGHEPDSVRFLESDIFLFLREAPPQYDMIILDPPKFARHAGEVSRASRGYKDINLLAFKKILPGGLVFTFSCSGAIDPYLFRQIVFAAAADSGRQVQLLHSLGAGPDHPVNIAHREGEYLKGLILRVR